MIVKEKIRNQNSEKKKRFKKEDKIYLQIKDLNLEKEIKKLKHTVKELFWVIRNI